MAVEKKKLPADIPPLTYGIWIRDVGWLRSDNGHYFADPRIEYAQEALKLWQPDDKRQAEIKLIDESMIGLQSTFLERERSKFVRKNSHNRVSLKVRLRRLLNGILGQFNHI